MEVDMKTGLTVMLLLCSAALADAAVVGKEVTYQAGATQLKGYLAYDDGSTKPRPGVLVVHEWWGHNDYARQRARMLAELGYIALAVDMYGDGKTANHPKDAGAFASAVAGNLPVAKQRFEAGMSLLKENALTDKGNIAAIGYCFGGGIVLAMARAGEDLKGVVSFHGSLGTTNPAQKGAIKAPILVLTGAADPMANAEVVKKFKQEMRAAGAKFDVVSYKGAKHAFTNPEADKLGKEFDMPLAYDKQADKDSWKRLQVFLKKVFK